MEAFLLKLLIFLGAATIAVPLARKFKLGSVLGYLIAGIVIGPFGLSLIDNIEAIMHFTEFGVVMMLFLVGLELKPSLLWQMRTPILGMGGSQVLVTFAAIGLFSAFFLPWQQSVAIGMILALSSTAIVLSTLREKGLMNTPPGQSIFSVLLFQDLAVIPMLALLPLLATAAMHADAHHGSALFDITALPVYLRLIVVLLSIGFIYVLGKYGSRPIFRAIAAARVREVFVAAALALVIGISLLMTAVGLSPALGTFHRRGGIGRQRVPPRAGKRYRAVQRAAAGHLFHLHRSQPQFHPHWRSVLDDRRIGCRFDRHQSHRPFRHCEGFQNAGHRAHAVYRCPGPRGRIRLRSVSVRQEQRRAAAVRDGNADLRRCHLHVSRAAAFLAA